jgi:hypothetical protein
VAPWQDVSESENAPGAIAGRLRKMGLHSTVAVPVIVDDRVWGMVALAGAIFRRPFAWRAQSTGKFITDGGPTVAFPRNQPGARRVVEALAEVDQLLHVHSG